MKYYIIAGERSGDLHASNLIKEISKIDNLASYRGVGGDYMLQAGVDLNLQYRDVAIMGFLEVLKNIRKIKRYIHETKNDILNFNPDVVILIDFAGFNLRIAKALKANRIPCFYYISPKIWAWNQKRAFKIKALVDKMFVILPFEKEFYQKFDYQVHYVGNPLHDAIRNYTTDITFTNRFMQGKPIIAILPGSRRQEILHILKPVLAIIDHFPQFQFVVAGVDNVPESLYNTVREKNIPIVFDHTYDLLSISHAAIVTSGTATLETALFNVPQVVCYKTSTVTYQIAKRLIKVPYISLVNLIAGDSVVTELIQENLNSSMLLTELKAITDQADKRDEILDGYKKINLLLGEKNASENTAKLMYNFLNEYKEHQATFS